MVTVEQLRVIVRDVVEAFVTEGGSMAPRRALVALTGAQLGFDVALPQLEALVADGWILDAVESAAARERLDQDRLRAIGVRALTLGAPTDHPLLVVAALSANTAAKLAHGIDDTPVTRAITDFLLSNRPVIAVTTAASPDSPERRALYPDTPEAFRAVLRANLQALRSFGVHLVAVQEIEAAVRETWRVEVPGSTRGRRPSGVTIIEAPIVRCHERLVSQRLVQPLTPGTVLRIDAAAIVTALARDTARARAIVVEREEEKRDVSRQSRGNRRLHAEG